MAVGSDSISELIKAFEAKAVSLQEKKNGGKPLQLLPTPFQLFQLGKVLFETEAQSTHQALLTSYHSLLDQLPECYLRQVLFHDLNLAFQAADDDSVEAIHAICGLYTDTPLACRAGFSVDVCRRISCVYDTLRNRQDHDHECTALLRTLSSLLLVGGLLDSNGDEDTQLRRIMEVAEALTEDEHNACLGDLMEWQEQTMPTRTLLATLKSKFEETPQREYMLLMLQSSPKTSDLKGTTAITSKQSQSTTFPKKVSAASEIQRRIQQVHNVLPDLGEGYIETALSCFQGDVSKTVAFLLEGQTDSSSLPPALQRIDSKLPARHVETTPNSYSLNDEEARLATKVRLAQMERVQEQEAYALTVVGNSNEYDDDYDDQYDGLDGGGELGGGDGESYDVDLDTIRTYNRATRQAEAEDQFWEESRNTNRQKPQTDRASEAKTYSGPDKGKGGRVIGPDGRYLPFEKSGKKAGKKPVENTTAIDQATSKPAANGKTGDATSSSIQKRRKNQNKAKLANHHRKERAQKKTAQGM
jgi:hypothetical protein